MVEESGAVSVVTARGWSMNHTSSNETCGIAAVEPALKDCHSGWYLLDNENQVL